MAVLEHSDIDYLEEFIGKEWLQSEFDKIDTKSPLRGAGTPFISYHPWVHYMYEIEYLLRRARFEGYSEVFLGPYYVLLGNAGMLLKDNSEHIVDKLDAKKRLQNPQQFYDFIWELETRTMLSRLGAQAVFIDPKSGVTYDGVVTINDHAIAFECKNKVIEDDENNTNTVFANLLVGKLGDVDSIQGVKSRIVCKFAFA